MATKARTRKPDAADRRLPRIAVVVSRYSGSITDRLLEGARSSYEARGGTKNDLHVYDAPGSFELPVIAAAAAASGHYEAIVALGCIIKGETRHDEVIADAIAQSLLDISISSGIPIGLGVLTVNTAAQAADRAGGTLGNKGADAMDAAIDAAFSVSQALSGRPARKAPARPIADKARRAKPRSAR